MAMATSASRRRVVSIECLAARVIWWRSSGTVTFKLDADASSHITALAAAEAKARGSIAGAGVGTLAQRMFRSKLLYTERVAPALIEEFGYPCMEKVPFIEKVVVNCNFRQDRTDALVLESTRRDLYILTGQRPTIFQAKLPIQGNPYRVGDPVGCFVTLRKELMYAFIDRLLNLVVPKTRNAQGVVTYGFRKGSYNMDLKDYSSAAESRLDHIHKPMGLRISLVTGANSRLEARRLLTLMGLPYFDETKIRQRVKKTGRKGSRKTAALAKGADKKKKGGPAKAKTGKKK